MSSTYVLAHQSLRPMESQTMCQSRVGVTLEMDGDYASSTESSFKMIMEKRPETDILVDFQTGVTSQCWSDVYIQIRY